MEVIPAINCMDFGCVSEKFLKLRGWLPKEAWVHLDITDAKFTYNKTWDDPVSFRKLREAHAEYSFNTEIHLMVEEPEKHITDWLEAGARRFVIHLESIVDTRFREKPLSPEVIIDQLKKRCEPYKAELLLSTNPETPTHFIEKYISYFTGYQVLAVRPGLAGQKFLSLALDKIRFLKMKSPGAIIEVDGGINPLSGRMCKDAGANVLVAANYIFESKDPRRAYQELLEI